MATPDLSKGVKLLRLGLLGYPLGHSLSPVLHETLMKKCNIEGEYLLYETAPANLKHAFTLFKTVGLQGVNITLPHKVAVSAYVDELDPMAEILGCVNTIVFRDGKAVGFNTDFKGFEKSLPSNTGERLSGASALVLGSGGSARMVISALLKRNTPTITVLLRSLAKAQDTIKHIEQLKTKSKSTSSLQWLNYDDIDDLSTFNLVINTTPVGMAPNMDKSPLPSALLATLPTGSFIYDLIYNPIQSQLLIDAEQAGHQTQGGLDMLLHQGIAAFEIWTGLTIDPTWLPELRDVLIQSIENPVSDSVEKKLIE